MLVLGSRLLGSFRGNHDVESGRVITTFASRHNDSNTLDGTSGPNSLQRASDAKPSRLGLPANGFMKQASTWRTGNDLER
jgi:hypothetical protein